MFTQHPNLEPFQESGHHAQSKTGTATVVGQSPGKTATAALKLTDLWPGTVSFCGPTVVKRNTNTASTSLFLHPLSCFKDPREEQYPSEMAEWNMGFLHKVLSFYICCTILPYDVSLVVAQHTPMPLQDYLVGAHSRRK